MDDVISQGRDPEREPRPAWPRGWRGRVAGGILLVAAAGLAVALLAPRHVGVRPTPASAPGSPAAAASADPAVVPERVAGPGLPPPPHGPGIVVCAPSTGVCSMRVTLHTVTVAPIGNNRDSAAQEVPIS